MIDEQAAGPTILSVNVGQLQTLPESRTRTGIFKEPVDGPVPVETEGLRGDHIGSTKYHGGPDQAICLYSQQDYDHWRQAIERDFGAGNFGENLTVSHYGHAPPRIGDRWHIGEVVLEISAPRIPCSTLARRVGDPKFVKTVARANRGGAYARVLSPGTLQAGQHIRIEPAGPTHPTVAELFEQNFRSKKDADLLRRALASPLSRLFRSDVEKWLSKL